jgi:hypothetical protein
MLGQMINAGPTQHAHANYLLQQLAGPLCLQAAAVLQPLPGWRQGCPRSHGFRALKPPLGPSHGVHLGPAGGQHQPSHTTSTREHRHRLAVVSANVYANPCASCLMRSSAKPEYHTSAAKGTHLRGAALQWAIGDVEKRCEWARICCRHISRISNIATRSDLPSRSLQRHTAANWTLMHRARSRSADVASTSTTAAMPRYLCVPLHH